MPIVECQNCKKFRFSHASISVFKVASKSLFKLIQSKVDSEENTVQVTDIGPTSQPNISG